MPGQPKGMREDGMMKKIWTMFLAAILIVPLLLQPATAQAAKAITINVDGVQLKLDQPPVMIQGRVMLPLRAIFEALDATVDWNQKSQTVTAIKADTTVVLKIKSKVATINNQSVTLDVPAQILRGRTMVPVRFVSEALGQDVDWNSRNQTVTIKSNKPNNPVKPNKPDTPSNISISPVSYVSVRDVGNQGDGRDLEVTYSKSSTESLVDHYRVLIVKASKSFNRTLAMNVSAANYTKVSPAGSDRSIILSQSSRDVDGDYIRNDQSYVAYVLTVGKGSYSSVLSKSSQKISLTNDSAVTAVTNVKISDISDFNDGRDISVSFTRPQNDNNISNYRVFIVKTKDANNFSLTTANNLSNSYYSTVNKSGSNGSTLTGALSSSARDTAGDSIKNGVPYTAFVLSVSSTNSADNKLSSASSSVTLSPNTVSTPAITQVDDVNDFGDGRDLRVSFNKVSDESNISSYRIFVVRANNYSNFTLTKANSLSSSYYTQVNKTGYNITQALSSGARDTDGYAIQNGVSYRVFVMAVATNSGNNVLSSVSNAITLYSNVGTVSNLSASDVGDYGNGRDLNVSFTKAANESNISQYRIMVVPTTYYSSFSLSDANSVSSSNYTTVNKSGNNTFGQVLSENARDVRGNKITDGISYQVYVLTVANGNSSNANALSSASSVITLSKNKAVQAVNYVRASDVSDYGDGRDLKIEFNHASDASNISEYRIMVVPKYRVYSFDASIASNIWNSNYTAISTSGSITSRVLDARATDIDGNTIKNDTPYYIFVLSVGKGSSSGIYTLSAASNEITLANTAAVEAVTNVSLSTEGNTGTYSDIRISFYKANNENNVAEYRVFLVPSGRVNEINVPFANGIIPRNYTSISPGQNIVGAPLKLQYDAFGAEINTITTYHAVIMTVANKSGVPNQLSNPSGQYVLPSKQDDTPVAAATIYAAEVDATGITVKFNKPDKETNISGYEVYIVNDGTDLTLDTLGQAIKQPVLNGSGEARLEINTVGKYKIYVLSISDTSGRKSALSQPYPTNVVTPAPSPDPQP